MKELVIKYIDKVIEYYKDRNGNSDALYDSFKLEEQLEQYLSYQKIDLIHDLAVNAHFCDKTHQDIYKAYKAFGFDDLDNLIEEE